jgi:methylase of polypeptide subunit release factors
MPGCGEAYEAEWIHKKFPAATCHYFDIDSHAIRKTRERLEHLNIAEASLWELDLTNKSVFPGSRPDLVLFFNPFVIEHAEYNQLVMTLNDKKTTDAKAETYLAKLVMSRQSQMIFANLLDQMERKNFISVTMDLAEAYAIHNFFKAKAIPVRCYRNPYAIRNLASLALGKRSPKTEPKIYHYILTAQTD